ncbi:MAG: alanine--glyoxylate aminotransferase family protein [Limnothrix sp.]
MEDKHMLMIPGPTPVPEQVLLEMAKHPIGHRSAAFSEIMAEVTENLKWLFQTKNDVFCLAASGTGAMEAGLINFIDAGEKVIVGENGKFGERWAIICETYGMDVERVSAPWGEALDPEIFKTKLEADTAKEIKAVVITHSETSTGVLNDLETISGYVKAHGALMIVDAVTSLGSCNVPTDEWGLDVVASGSQKGFMIPPGLGFVSVSDKAWTAYETAKIPRFYFDLKAAKKSLAKNTTPFTPPVNLIFALKAALGMMKREGLETIFARHQRLTEAARAAVKALGLKTFAPDSNASTAVTAVDPAPVGAEDIRKAMAKQFDISLAGGQDDYKGKIFRIGHLGFVHDRDLLTAIAALEATLHGLGHTDFESGAGVKAAAEVFQKS